MANFFDEVLAAYKGEASAVFELTLIDTNEYTITLKNTITQAGTPFSLATIATSAEALAGTANDHLITPLTLAGTKVLGYANLAAFPSSLQKEDTIYIAEDTDYLYRWDGAAYTQVGGSGGGGGGGVSPNILINGNFDIPQQGTSFNSTTTPANNDNTYLLDMWNMITDGNDVFDVAQESISDLPKSNYAIKLDVETSKRGGIVQFIEAKDAQKYQDTTVSLSFAVKSANVSAIRAAVLSWDSTADTLTSDVVSVWGATPTWATNWTEENTPADLTVTSSWTTVTIDNISIDTAGMNNLAVAIWLPNEETIGDIIYISQVKLEEGEATTDFEITKYVDELFRCQRLYYRLSVTSPATRLYVAQGGFGSGTVLNGRIELNVPMRIIPTSTVSNISHFSLADLVSKIQVATSFSVVANDTSNNIARMQFTASGGTFVAGHFGSILITNTGGWIDFDARL